MARGQRRYVLFSPTFTLTMQIDRLTSTAAKKAVSGYDENELVVLRDSIDFTAQAATGSTFEFFPTNASSSEVEDNYRENPLRASQAHDIVAIGLNLNPGILENDGGLDVLAAYSALTHGRLIFETSDQDILLRRHVQEHLVTEDHDFVVVGDAANNQFRHYLDASGQPIVPIEEPLRLGRGEVFDLNVEVAHSGNLPDNSDYSAQQTAQLTAFMAAAKIE